MQTRLIQPEDSGAIGKGFAIVSYHDDATIVAARDR
jgi:hypothetical protein